MTTPPSLGILELSDRGAGFVRRRQCSYLPEDGDYYVPPRLVGQYGLRTGDELWGELGRSPGRGKAAPVESLSLVNGRPPDEMRRRPAFGSLGAIHPDAPLRLDCGLRRYGQPDYTNRVIDLLCPFGKGQRALIVAPAKAGKTMVLQAVAEGIAKNHPNALLLILLVDERPEEVTEMEMIGFGEVVSSSFDFPAERHVAVAELTLERARRRVEMGEDVVLILDSITRLARAYNTVERGTGRTMTGGLDSSALEKPKRFLGSARRIDESRGGGSLTIIGTALIDTGSKMDQVIYEEFKGTGNSELTLSRELAERRIFPAIDLKASGTRREELLLPPPLLAVATTLRSRTAPMTPVDAMQQVLTLMRRSATNAELVAQVD
ncbi:MAG: transcription termination factor Rho [Gemmatimonadetes bacterium]|nr:transcription termination factor Rho [Gemmatimonadota bacterium]MBP6668127.1 transcription termination factor Rho [Gemmatimonadales bacterium]MBK6781874.1 transcription termination factor Rho [Gemmatimonadota bacterium]MBK7352047.1 transcription termination factor Rho [Gemmatimonadota bacterium]MBK7717224.1 transcription termination factor Rho [Gemmatimonadota bacterium]